MAYPSHFNGMLMIFTLMDVLSMLVTLVHLYLRQHCTVTSVPFSYIVLISLSTSKNPDLQFYFSDIPFNTCICPSSKYNPSCLPCVNIFLWSFICCLKWAGCQSITCLIRPGHPCLSNTHFMPFQSGIVSFDYLYVSFIRWFILCSCILPFFADRSPYLHLSLNYVQCLSSAFIL